MPFINGRAVSDGYLQSGLKGPKGNQGNQGNHGGTGPQGETGASGAGYTGLQGLTGLPGIGSTGIQGETGLIGSTGLSGGGETGLVGSTGLRGLQGETGFSVGGGGTGLQGVTGFEGFNGIDGPQGETGLAGLDGLDGPQGDPGLVGLSTLTSQVSISNTTSETTILTHTLPPGAIEVGSQFKFLFYGTHQNQATSGTLTFRMYIGGNASQTIQLTSGAARAQTYMEFYGLATVRTIGTSGTYINSGIYQIHTSSTATTRAYQGGATTTVVNTAAPSSIVRITAQWQTASATNTLLIQNATIEKVK